MNNYNSPKIESKWQKKWQEEGVYQPNLETAQNPFYNLMMFPYPSAEGLHVGNMYAFTGSDIYGRYQRMRGKDVFEPIGLDGFGIHSENYALKVNQHPKEVAARTRQNFYKQLQSTGNAYAWENKLETFDPDYYKWTQWVFVQMYKNGLAYRKKASVNWCPSCKTVLADEQVEGGKCERCDSEVTRKELEQWFFRITQYADRLLENLQKIDWSPRVKEMQRNWIGKSVGVTLNFGVKGGTKEIDVFTTRPDTINSATFMVLAPEHPLLGQLELPKDKEQSVHEYIHKSLAKTNQERRRDTGKSGVFTGLYGINPYNNEKLPIWISDFVLMDYGTGAIMAVPAYDERDREFAEEFSLPIRENELLKMDKIKKQVVEGGWGEETVNYKLRDWLISRQRYWGPPIPMISCDNCGWVPVPEEELPVMLPEVENWKPLGTGEGPLAQLEDWVKTKCPKCGGEARRETDVSDTFLDSSWYFLRYPSNSLEIRNSKLEIPWDQKATQQWLPVDMYIGGAEHSVLHLLYARFVTMVFNDLGLIDFEEPFSKFRAHGLIIRDGSKMSKSKGNVVIPDEYIKEYGADTLRMYLMFLGPFTEGGDFQDEGIKGVVRFLQRVWRATAEVEHSSNAQEPELESALHRLIKKVSEDIEALKYNTAIAAMMEFMNKVEDKPMSLEDWAKFLKLLAPFAPHITEELWQTYCASDNKRFLSIHQESWPQYDEELIKKEVITVAVQVDGKVRGAVEIRSTKSEIQNEVEEIAKGEGNVGRHLEDKEIKEVIFVPGKIINFVTS